MGGRLARVGFFEEERWEQRRRRRSGEAGGSQGNKTAQDEATPGARVFPEQHGASSPPSTWRVPGSPEAGMGGVGRYGRLFGQGKWRREMPGSNRKPSAHQEQRRQVLAFVCPTTGCPAPSAVHKGAKPVACVTRLENKEARPSFIVPVLSSCGAVLTHSLLVLSSSVGSAWPGLPCCDTLLCVALGGG